MFYNGLRRASRLLSLFTFVSVALAGSAALSAPEDAFFSRFTPEGTGDGWTISNYSNKHDYFRTAWLRETVGRGSDGGIAIALRAAPEKFEKDLIGGEVQRVRRTHFGRYEVVMRAAPGDGVISSFFLYTGPYFGDPHDEIDIEFLGRDTTKVWLNRFVAGKRLPGQWVDLGFDAADGPHLYTIDWLPDRIVWYADGRELLRITDADTAIPQRAQRIFLNIWGGNKQQRDWSGAPPNEGTDTAVQYLCVSYRAPDVEGEMCSDEADGGAPADG